MLDIAPFTLCKLLFVLLSDLSNGYLHDILMYVGEFVLVSLPSEFILVSLPCLQDKFLPFLDMFQKESIKVEVCKHLTESYIK